MATIATAAQSPKLPKGMVKRGRTYHADFHSKGQRICKSLSRNLKVARELFHELQARTNRGDFGLLDNDFSVKLLKEQYLRDCRQTKKPGTVQRYEYNLAAILPEMPERVTLVRIDQVLQYRERRLAKGTATHESQSGKKRSGRIAVSPRTVNMDVEALARMFRWGVKHGLIGQNPIDGIEPLPHDHPKEGRPLERDEVDRLLELSPQPWRDVWYAFLVTGMRKSELAELHFSDVDWDTRELKIRRGVAKNHNARRIAIEPGLWTILCRQMDRRKDRQEGKGCGPRITARIKERFTRSHIFVTTQNTPLTHGSGLYYAFLRCCKLAEIQTRRLDIKGYEIDHVDLHSLRRTFATDLIENGADPKTVQELLGHKTLTMTMDLYAKIRSGSKHQAVARLSYRAGGQTRDDLLNCEFEGKKQRKNNATGLEDKIEST